MSKEKRKFVVEFAVASNRPLRWRWRTNQTSKYLLEINYQRKGFLSAVLWSVWLVFIQNKLHSSGIRVHVQTLRHFFHQAIKTRNKRHFPSPADGNREARACTTVLGRCRIFIFHSSVKYQKLTATEVHCLLRLLLAFWGVERLHRKLLRMDQKKGEE